MKTANKSDQKTRYILCTQERDLSDALIPGLLRLGGQTGMFSFHLHAETDADEKIGLEALSGRIFIVHREAKHWDRFQNAACNARDALFEVGHIKRGSLRDNFGGKFSEAKALLVQHCDLYCDICLQRNGFLSLTNVTLKRIRGSKDDIAPQIYYFLRDICHRHQHHKRSSDTIIDLYSGDDFPNWHREVLYSLFRKIIQFKRHRNPETVASSLGVLAYARAFRSVCERAPHTANTPINLPHYDFDAIEKSLIVARDDLTTQSQADIRAGQRRQTLFIALLTVLISLVSLLEISSYEQTIEPAVPLVFMAEGILKAPAIAFVLLALPFVLLEFFVRHGSKSFANFRAVRGTYRTFAILKKSYAVALASIGALASFGIAYYLLR